MSAPTPQSDVRKLVGDPEVRASLLMVVGAPVWRFVNHLSNVDFLLSFTGERFSMVLTFLQDYGWLIVMLGGIAIIYAHWRDRKRLKPSASPNWLTVFAVAILAFLFGISAAIQIVAYPPSVVIAWGGVPHACNAVIDGGKLGGFSKQYKLALACGILNPSIDKLRDQNITLSNIFDIIPQQIPIVAEYSSRTNRYENLLNQVNPTGKVQTWYNALLVPNNIVLEHMGTLQEFRANGGKVLGYD